MAHICNLPLELIWMMVRFLDERSLKNFFRVCRQIYTALDSELLVFALFWAASNNCEKTAKNALEKGANANAKNAEGNTPLVLAIRRESLEVAWLLLKWPSTNVNMPTLTSPLGAAAAVGATHIVSYLLKHPETDINWRQRSGRTPLSFAAGLGQLEIVRILLSHTDIDINARDIYNQTALCRAMCNNEIEIVRELLKVNGIDLDAKNGMGEPLLVWAVRWHSQEIAALILGHKGINVNEKDVGGMTALDWAIKKGNTGMASIISAYNP